MFTKVLATISNYPRNFYLKITRPVNRYLMFLSVVFMLLSILLVVFFHLVALYTKELLLVLVVADSILCWVTLRFRLIHTSKKEVVSNMYLFYCVLLPSSPLLVYTIREYRKIKSFRITCSYTERVFYQIIII